jgi:hypothetical protein
MDALTVARVLGRLLEAVDLQGQPMQVNGYVPPLTAHLPDGTPVDRVVYLAEAAREAREALRGFHLPARPYRYEEAARGLADVLTDLRSLAGDEAGGGATWQDVAGTCAVSLRVLASRLDSARKGLVVDGPVVFPSVDEILDEVVNGEDDEDPA